MSAVVSRWSRISFTALAAIILITGVSISRAAAQGVFVRRVQEIYEGTSAEQAGIKLGSWGSGICEESSQNTMVGSKSLKITPRGLHTGGRIDFDTPLDLSPSFKTPDTYLQFACQFWGAQATDSLTQALGTAAAPSDMYGGESAPGKHVKHVRVALYFEKGASMEIQAPLSAFKIGDDGWMIVSFPIAALKGKAEMAQYRVTRMLITGDGTEPFFIGEIRTVPDTSPLVPDAGEDMEVSKNYPIAFQGFCQSGASAVNYSWDFDKKNGIQEEAVGDLTYHRFTQAGDYDVTLTVTDMFGIKQPVTKMIHVKVNE